MKNIIIAKRYAAAAMQSLSPDKYEEVLNQIHLMVEIFGKSEKIKKMLLSAFVKKEDKLNFIKDFTQGVKNQDFWQKILNLLVLKNRSQIMHQFFIEFEIMLYHALDKKKIILTFANAQDDETVDKVKNELERILQKNIVCDIQVDKELIGGFVAIDKNTVIDASIRSNLNRFTHFVAPTSQSDNVAFKH